MIRNSSLEAQVPIALSSNKDNDSPISPPEEPKIPALASNRRDDGNFSVTGDCLDLSQKYVNAESQAINSQEANPKR